MTNRPTLKKEVSSKTILLLSIFAIVLLAVVCGFLVFFAYPMTDNFMSVYVPAKSGGRDYFIDIDELMLIGGIAIAVAIGLVGIVAVFLKQHNKMLALLFALALIGLATIFSATFVGNAFDELWGGWWSVLGVAIVLGVGFFCSGSIILIVTASSKK